MSVTGTHFYDGGHTSQISDGTISGSGVSLTMPIGDMSLTASSSETDESGTNYASTGAALTMTAGNGTLSVGFESTSNDTAGVATEGEAYSASYSTTVGSAAIAIGYTGFDAGSAGNTSQKTDVTLSQSLGGGASVFAEMSSLTVLVLLLQQTLQLKQLLQLVQVQLLIATYIYFYKNQGLLIPGFFLFIFD